MDVLVDSRSYSAEAVSPGVTDVVGEELERAGELGSGRDGLTAVGKALSIIELFESSTSRFMGVSDVARMLGIPKSTAHRLVKVMTERGFLDTCGGKYRLGRRLVQIGAAAQWSRYGPLRDVATPLLENLFESVRQTVHLAVLDGDQVLYLEKITASGGCMVPSRVGARLPATCTALGKAILAFSSPEVVRSVASHPLHQMTPYSVGYPRALLEQLGKAKRESVAYEVEESRLGITCVAAPVFSVRGVLGAVSVAGLTSRFRPEAAASAVHATATTITSKMERFTLKLALSSSSASPSR